MLLTIRDLDRAIADTGPFDFDWTWGAENYDGDLVDVDALCERDAAYYADVRAAQNVAAAAMDEARTAYAKGDLNGTLAAVRRASAAEKEFGDDPTYGLIRETLEALVGEEA